MATNPTELPHSAHFPFRTSSPGHVICDSYINRAFDLSPTRPGSQFRTLPANSFAHSRPLHTSSPRTCNQHSQQDQLRGRSYTRNETSRRNVTHTGHNDTPLNSIYSKNNDPQGDHSHTVYDSPRGNQTHIDDQDPHRPQPRSPRHYPTPIPHNGMSRYKVRTGTNDPRRKPLSTVHPTLTQATSPQSRSPSLTKVTEDGEDSVQALTWDSGYGAYVPRSSVAQPKVYIRVVFLKIGEIDTLKEQFRAEIFVQARWREPQLDNCSDVEDIEWDELWNPQLQLENAMDEPRTTVWYDISVSENGEAFVLEKRRVKADFAETLELQSFPFDIQHLSILITSQLSDSSLELLEDDKELSSVNLLSFVDEQEWEVRNIVEAKAEIRSREFSAMKHKFPMITVRTYAIRRAGFFVWNVLAIMVLICSLSLCTFAVSKNLPQNRLQLSFTLVLTGIAFKFVVGQSLPKIPYLTVLDKYILGSMVLMHVVSVWHAIITRVSGSLADQLDNWAFIVLAIMFTCYNTIFGLTMIIKIYIKRKFVGVLEAEYQTKVDKMRSQVGDPQGRVMKKNRHKNSNSRVHSF